MRLLITLSFLFLALVAFGQPDQIVELEKRLETSRSPKEQVELLCLLSEQYYFTSADKTLLYAQRALDLAQQHNDRNGIAYASHRIAIAYNLSGNTDKAVTFFYKSLRIREDLNDSSGQAALYNDLANVMGIKHDTASANLLYTKSLRIAEAIHDTAAMALALYNLGYGFSTQQQYEKALAYTMKAVHLRELINDKHDYAAGLNSIGSIYMMQGKWKEAIPYHTQALEYTIKIKNDLEKSYALAGLSDAYAVGGKYDKALSYALESFAIVKKINAKFELNNMAYYIHELYKEQGNYKEARKYLKLHDRYADSTYSVEGDAKIEELQLAYRNEKAEQENKLLKAERDLKNRELERKNTIQLCIAALLLMASVAAFVLFRGRQHLSSVNKQLVENSRALSRQKEELTAQAALLQEQKHDLERLHTVKDRLFSVIAHDLKGPLTSLQGLLKIAATGAIPPDKFKTFMAALETSQQNALWLLDNLLVWAKTQMKGIAFRPKNADMNKLVQESIKLILPQAQQKGVILIDDLPEDVKAFADAETIRVVLRNLLANAIKFCNTRDTVTISTAQQGNFLQVSVTDTGTGIKTEDIEKLFRTNNYTTSGTGGEKGSGLGLTLCKEFVEQNGGSIWVESEYGQGSTFYFTLPSHIAVIVTEEPALQTATSC